MLCYASQVSTGSIRRLLDLFNNLDYLPLFAIKQFDRELEISVAHRN